ncbi:MAG: alkaline phosphatase family protein, partial [Promethearchaeota archaeon]
MKNTKNIKEIRENYERFAFNIMIDDCYGPSLFKFAEEGLIPNIKKYILGKNNSKAVFCRNCIAPFPASSTNGHTTLLTGCYNARSGVLNASFWKNTCVKNIEGDIGKQVPEWLQLDKVTLKAFKIWKHAISDEIKTLFQLIPDSISYHIINKGARIKFFNYWKVIKSLPIYIKMKLGGSDKIVSDLDFWPAFLRKMLKKSIIKMNKRGLPQYSFLLFLPSDAAAHYYGFHSNEYKNTLKLLDDLIGMLVEGYDEPKGKGKGKGVKHYKGLKELGYLDKILWVIESDHSSKPNPHFFDLVKYLRENRDLNVCDAKYKRIPKNVRKKYPNFKKNPRNADILTDQMGEFAQIYVRSSLHNFNDNLTKTELQNHFSLSGKRINILRYLQGADALGRIVFRQKIFCPDENKSEENEDINGTRENRCFSRNYCLRVISKSGESLIFRNARVSKGTNINKNEEINTPKYAYVIVKGKDPLYFEEHAKLSDKITRLEDLKLDVDFGDEQEGLLKDGLDVVVQKECNLIKDIWKKLNLSERFFDSETWLECSYDAEMPNIIERYFGYFDHESSPNLIFVAERGYRFYSEDNPKDKSKIKVQSHDAEYKEESIVPAVFS